MATPEELARMEAGPQSPAERIWFDKYSHQRLQGWRQVQDPFADACTEQMEFRKPSGLLDEVERRARQEGGVFRAFLDECFRVPDWVDFEMMEAGRRFCRRYGALQGLILMCSSLVEGYAHNKPSQVLVASLAVPFRSGRRCHSLIQRPSLKMTTMPPCRNTSLQALNVV